MPCSTGLRACARRNPSCQHLQSVRTYLDMLQHWHLRREAENPGMYAAELQDWDRENPCPTFKDYLLAVRVPAEARQAA